MRLHDYLARVRVSAPVEPTLETLRRLHTAHREAFLFENLSIQSGGGISVALDDIERKFLDEGRGGYCFEHNTLFAGVLRDVGFAPTALLGRVRRGPPDRWARTHMVLCVPIADGDGASPTTRSWLADVGFGAVGLVEPIPLEDGASSTQRGLRYTLRREQHIWVLSMQDAAQHTDLYEFSEDPQTTGDIVVANHYTATHPESVFRRTLTIQRVRGDERLVLRNETLTRWDGGHVSEESVDRRQLPEIAKDLFGVDLPGPPLVFDQEPSRG